MAKVSAMTTISALAIGDLLYVVDDPGGTALSRAIAIEDVLSSLPGDTSITGKLAVAGNADVVTNNVTGASGQTADLARWELFGASSGATARITSAGAFSNNSGLSLSEAFGAGATNNSAIQSTAVGANASASAQSVAFGYLAGCGSNCVAVGRASVANGSQSVAIGWVATTGNDQNSIAIGAQASTAGFASSVALGRLATVTAVNQFVCGASLHPMTNVYFGKGVSNATPTTYIINGTHGSGDNVAGASIQISPGAGTGSGLPGSFIVKTAPADSGVAATRNDNSATVIEASANATVALLGFFGAAPAIQQAGTGEGTGFTAGSGTAVNDVSTFTGNVGATAYRINDIVKALKNLGLLAQ